MTTLFSKLRNLRTSNSEADFIEIGAFPRELATVVRGVIAKLVKTQMHTPSSNVFQVRLQGEALNIPYRVYYSKEQLLAYADNVGHEGTVSLCLGTRHFDGFVREKCIKRLLERDAYWTVPFVIQLLGEYVLEVALPIEQALPSAIGKNYAGFLNENVSYFETTGRRTISYWNAYYRQQYPQLKEYPPFRAITALKKIRITCG